MLVLKIDDLAYLGKVADAIKTDVTPILPQLTTECPECGESPIPGDDAHIVMNTAIGSYWEERGEINHLGMKHDDAPFVLIGCEGYHLVQF